MQTSLPWRNAVCRAWSGERDRSCRCSSARKEGRCAHRDFVGIGGSLGAVDALRQLCRELPADLPAAILVVVHTHAGGPNYLADSIGSASALPVGTASDGEPVRPGRVYVAPADHHMLLMDGVVRLGRGPRENTARPAIDPLFRSLGVCCGPRAVGVILTGTLNDGAAGLSDLKRCGGVTLVQNPADASAAEMPLSARRASEIDYRATIVDMPELLTHLVREKAGAAPAVPPEVLLEAEIALGRSMDDRTAMKLGSPVPLSCPCCGGVLNEMERSSPLRFRCQVGHAYTAEALANEQEGSVDEAVRVALRIIQERVVLTERMVQEARRNGRNATANILDSRLKEYQEHADLLRKAALRETA